jgi:hypothetical protein
MGVRGKTLVRLDSLSNLLRNVADRTIVLLLIGSRFVGIVVALIHFCIVRGRSILPRRILG